MGYRTHSAADNISHEDHRAESRELETSTMAVMDYFQLSCFDKFLLTAAEDK